MRMTYMVLPPRLLLVSQAVARGKGTGAVYTPTDNDAAFLSPHSGPTTLALLAMALHAVSTTPSACVHAPHRTAPTPAKRVGHLSGGAWRSLAGKQAGRQAGGRQHTYIVMQQNDIACLPAFCVALGRLTH